MVHPGSECGIVTAKGGRLPLLSSLHKPKAACVTQPRVARVWRGLPWVGESQDGGANPTLRRSPAPAGSAVRIASGQLSLASSSWVRSSLALCHTQGSARFTRTSLGCDTEDRWPSRHALLSTAQFRNNFPDEPVDSGMACWSLPQGKMDPQSGPAGCWFWGLVVGGVCGPVV